MSPGRTRSPAPRVPAAGGFAVKHLQVQRARIRSAWRRPSGRGLRRGGQHLLPPPRSERERGTEETGRAPSMTSAARGARRTREKGRGRPQPRGRRSPGRGRGAERSPPAPRRPGPPVPEPHEPLPRAPGGRSPPGPRGGGGRRGCCAGCSAPAVLTGAGRGARGPQGAERGRGEAIRAGGGARSGEGRPRGAVPAVGRRLLLRGPLGAGRPPLCPRPRPLPPRSQLSASFPPLFRSSPEIQDGGAEPVT